MSDNFSEIELQYILSFHKMECIDLCEREVCIKLMVQWSRDNAPWWRLMSVFHCGSEISWVGQQLGGTPSQGPQQIRPMPSQSMFFSRWITPILALFNCYKLFHFNNISILSHSRFLSMNLSVQCFNVRINIV